MRPYSTLVKNMSDTAIQTAIETWLDTFIIAHNICPFAKRERERNSIRFVVSDHRRMEDALEKLMQEIAHLDANLDTETTLLIWAEGFRLFDDYLDLLAIGEQLLHDQGYEGIYQLASFHPDYCFEGSDEDDPANYTNRSPYPMLHIIRESSIENALKTFPNPETIPERNIALMRELGLETLKTMLNR
jgi:hypothetical protein